MSNIKTIKRKISDLKQQQKVPPTIEQLLEIFQVKTTDEFLKLCFSDSDVGELALEGWRIVKLFYQKTISQINYLMLKRLDDIEKDYINKQGTSKSQAPNITFQCIPEGTTTPTGFLIKDPHYKSIGGEVYWIRELEGLNE